MDELGGDLLLASRRIQPAKLLAAGYRFRFPELGDALRHQKERLGDEALSTVAKKAPTIRV